MCISLMKYVLIGAGTALLATSATSDWPQFLGPQRNGTSTSTISPNALRQSRQLWKKTIGAGFSAPVVSGGKLILFHRLDNKETVECLNASTGDRIWSFEYPTSYRDDFGFDEGPRGTPAIASTGVYTFGGGGGPACNRSGHRQETLARRHALQVRCPHITPGVETTTGPLGQGITNAVGMALAEKLLAAEFNQGDLKVVDHYTYAFMGDGCLMEGISHEACSLAGTLQLNKLIAFWDDNGISIDGHVEGWFTDNTPKRFEAYGWNVIPAIDGHNAEAVSNAIAAAKTSDKPTLICCKTVIGKGSPNMEGTHNVHGAALGDKEIAAVRSHIGWEYPPFEVPADVYEAWDAKADGAKAEAEWNTQFAAYAAQFPQKAAELTRRMNGVVNSRRVGAGCVSRGPGARGRACRCR